MKRLDLSKLSVPDAMLIQHGLNSQGLLNLPKPQGLPGPKTNAAYDAWWNRFVTPPKDEQDLADIQVFRKTLVRVLESQVGVHEVGGNNRGAQIDAYEGATWLDPRGDYAWCASFICWVIWEALKATGFQPEWSRPRTPGAYAFRDQWGPENKERGVEVIWDPYGRILPGDIIVFTFSHIGMARAESAPGASVLTIEGNTNAAGSREGDGVYRKTRKRSQISAIIRIASV